VDSEEAVAAAAAVAVVVATAEAGAGTITDREVRPRGRPVATEGPATAI
jgi:hypothetical protein